VKVRLAKVRKEQRVWGVGVGGESRKPKKKRGNPKAKEGSGTQKGDAFLKRETITNRQVKKRGKKARGAALRYPKRD